MQTDTIRTLIRSLDDDDGVSETAYDDIYNAVCDEYGEEAGAILSNAVEATDGAFYIEEGSADELIASIENA